MFIFADAKNQKCKDVTIMDGFKNIDKELSMGYWILLEV